MPDSGQINPPKVPDAEVREKGRGISVVWLVPLVAVLISGWLVYKSFTEEGPVVQVTFQRAGGIEPGKTQVKYRDITVGEVKNLRFSEDLTRVVVTIQLVVGAESQLTDSTRFWIVRPRIGKSGISGIGTLLSGVYIALDPGAGGKAKRSFTGLKEPPGVETGTPGKLYRLTARSLGSVSVGSSVYYRGITVGRVVQYRLAEDYSHVAIDIFVDAPHDGFVRRNTRFWNVSGIEVDLSAQGVKVGVESFASVFAGGVAFETPPGKRVPEPAEAGAIFTLHQSRTPAREEVSTITLPYLMYFDDSVRGLSVGAPVEFRGIRVGTVTDIALEVDVDTSDIRIPVMIELEPDRIPDRKGGVNATRRAVERKKEGAAVIGKLVRRGLRAKLQRGSLVTGKLLVELDLYPGADPVEVAYEEGTPVLPTVSGTLSDVVAQANSLMERLEALPLEESVESLNTTLAQTETLLLSLTQTSDEIKAGTLQEMNATTRSMRVLLEYLQQHPEALIKGKGSP